MSVPTGVPESSALILVADDVTPNREILEQQLNDFGYRVVTASDAPSALAACFDRRPDLCILDIAMPAGSLGVSDRSAGFEICRRIKKDARTARIPVIFLTALNDASHRVQAIEAGGDDFITRPHNRVLLGARVKSLLKLKSATDELETSYRKLRELEKVRDDLLKMIVHDLKTPLTSVLATLEMLLDGDFGPVNERQRKAVGDAEEKAEDLLALIEDLLEVARIDEVNVALNHQQIAPAAILAETVHEWEHRFQQSAAVASVEVTDDAPVFEADRALLKRVFSNLVQNALLHSQYGVKIRLAARREGDSVLFTIADNGPGIPPEYQELIFRKFQQGRQMRDLPRARSSGLGLAFCRVVADAHGGRIWVRSTEGEGSSFHLSLPCTARKGAASPPSEE